MKPSILLKMATFCILFFVVGHSIGHITRKDSTDPKAREVFRLMEEYQFPIGNQLRSYDEFYTGMSLNLIASLVALGVLLWIASGIVTKETNTCRKMLIPILLCLLAYTITGFLYFFIVPAVTCLLASLLISYSLYLLSRDQKASEVKKIMYSSLP